MTNVLVINDLDSWKINVNGHAGYAPKGTDIVCAAISTITAMIAQELVYDAEDVKITKYVMDEENADVSFEFNTLTDAVNNKISMAVMGFELIASNYPDFVRLTLKCD